MPGDAEGVRPSPSRRRCPGGGGRDVAVVSVVGQLVGGGSSGVGGAVEEVGEQLKLVVAVAGAELVHRGVHPC